MKVMVSTIQDPSGRIQQLVRSLGPDGRAELNAGASAQLFADCRAHLRSYAASHHATANRLGAFPTGHLGKAATNMRHESNTEAAFVTVSSPGIRRTFAPLNIHPVRARALTIPVHALAYGKRVAELARYHKVFRPKGKNILATTIDGELTPLYALVKSVTIPQDRKLLPSDAELSKSVRKGYLGVIRNVIAKTMGGAA